MNDNKDLITIFLIGDGLFSNKNDKLESVEVHCSHYNNCEFYKKGQCLSLNGLDNGCKFGTYKFNIGYTKRSKKYYEWKRKWENHEKYMKLKGIDTSIKDVTIGKIDNYIVIKNKVIGIRYNSEEDKYNIIEKRYRGSDLNFIKESCFTYKLLNRILKNDYNPIKINDNDKFESFKRSLLFELKNYFGDNFIKGFISKYPDCEKYITPVGQYVYLNTLNKNIEVITYEYKSSETCYSKWFWDGEYLTYIESQYDINLQVGERKGNKLVDEIKIKPNEKFIVKVTDESQVNQNTKFVGGK